MSAKYKIERRVCKDPECKKEYDATVCQLMGVKIVMGDGWCPECNESFWKKKKAEEKLKLDASNNHTRRLWRLRCGIPPKFQNEDFSTFIILRQPKAFKVCWDYAENYPLLKPRGYKSLVLFSEQSWGVGKTHLSCSIGHRILDRWNGEDINCPVLFVSEPDLYLRLQATYQDRGIAKETEADIIKQLVGVDLLIMDDIGKRRVVDPKFVQRIMFAVIDGRYKTMRPMVLTANLSPDGLGEYLGGGRQDEASIDRLVEMSGKHFDKMEGKSYRSGV